MVTNTAANPVPEVGTGIKDVKGTVTISGTPSVTLANGPTVNACAIPVMTLGPGAAVAVDPAGTLSPSDGTVGLTAAAKLPRFCPLFYWSC